MATSDGTVYEKASTNAECCESRSITESEDGTQWRWPLLYQNDDGTFKCMGGHKKTYQEWVDFAGSRYENICIDGWRYSKTGIVINTIKCQYMHNRNGHICGIDMLYYIYYISE